MSNPDPIKNRGKTRISRWVSIFFFLYDPHPVKTSTTDHYSNLYKQTAIILDNGQRMLLKPVKIGGNEKENRPFSNCSFLSNLQMPSTSEISYTINLLELQFHIISNINHFIHDKSRKTTRNSIKGKNIHIIDHLNYTPVSVDVITKDLVPDIWTEIVINNDDDDDNVFFSYNNLS